MVLTSNRLYYTPSQINEAVLEAGIINTNTKNKIEYYNAPFAFDIETTSFYNSNQLEEKCAIMYEWTLGLNGVIVIGRTWEEFLDVCTYIVEWYELSVEKRIIIYVHNLAFEFQFMRKRFDWESVFSLEQRKPISALTTRGIEFRCSYLLSGYSLKNLSNQLTKYKVEKMVGDLDYSLIRNSKTPLTDKEIGYCINDVKVVMSYIQEIIETKDNIAHIPLTKTGYVRKYCRDMCLYKDDDRNKTKYHNYRNIMENLTLDSEIYKQLKRAFSGGFTHASSYYVDETIKNVGSFDFTSSYPYVMISEEFPMSTAIHKKITSMEQFENYLNIYCCLFDIVFEDIESTVIFENYISKSHCRQLEKSVENNGRIVKAKHLEITLTEQDYFIIKKLYKWNKATVYNFNVFKKAYLPRDLVYSILKLYVDKTTLKGIEGMENEYLNSKEKINAVYGMTVTDICRDENIYENDIWYSNEGDIEEDINKYNKSKKRILYYPWGVWVTAYARKNLFMGILEFGEDYIYSDTDSIKAINISNHLEFINNYNNSVLKKLEKAMNYQGISIEMTRPKNIKGEKKQIGIWDYEGQYDKFKTLGAKRYMTEKDGKIQITVSGLNKETASRYLVEKYKDKVFDYFDNELYVPKEYTGKMTHTYIDEEKMGHIKDYLGNIDKYDELSSVHLENAEYSLSLADQFIDYILGIKTLEY